MSTQAKFIRPKIGCEHFRSVVKKIRSENNTLKSGLKDVLDNIYGIAKANSLPYIKAIINVQFHPLDNTMYRISVSDNIPHGFKQILFHGIDNPLNMGHIRDGHSDDAESSEFGTGLKKAIIYISERCEIVTRSINDNGEENFVRVVFDIPYMLAKHEPEESYEPTSFELINQDIYNQAHPFETGSTIEFQNLNIGDFSYDQETGAYLSQEDFIANLNEDLSKAYSDLIRDEVFTIELNGQEVLVDDDLFAKIPDTHKKHFEFYAKLNSKNDVEKIVRKGLTQTGRNQYQEFDNSSKSATFKKMSPDEFIYFTSEPNVYLINMNSLTTKNTKYQPIQHHDFTDINRGGRCYTPAIKITKQEMDGYSNHIYNCVKYDNKRLNKMLGVGPNKTVTKPTNMLISAILITQKETTKKWRDYNKKGTMNDDSDDSDESSKKNKKKKPAPKPTPKPEPVYINEPEPVHIDDPEPIYINEPEPVHINEPEPVHIDDPEPLHINEPEPVHIDDPEPLHINEPEPVHINEPNPVYSGEPEPVHIDEPEPVHINEPNPVYSGEPEPVIDIIDDPKPDHINEPNPVYSGEPEPVIDIIENSKSLLRQAAKKLMELAANEDFDREDGYKILEFVEMYINN
jgi:hypothetical protein